MFRSRVKGSKREEFRRTLMEQVMGLHHRSELSRRGLNECSMRCGLRRLPRMEKLETRNLLASVSAPPILQWFDSSFETIEERLPDLFQSGYGAVWLPPPGRADSGNQSVGYDVYDRFDLGSADNETLYGTQTGLQQG